jgi:segregation and condensation protein A
MQTMPVDIAADYLVMAATLAYLKSRELVPAPEPLEAAAEGEEAEALDPRQELIRRLLEYQKYKDAAEKLGGRPIEGRNVFGRGGEIEVENVGGAPVADESVWKLIEAFGRILEKAGSRGPVSTHNVVVDRISIGSRINDLVDRMKNGGGSFRFDTCFDLSLPEPELRHQVVVTLLAILELAKMKVIRVLQSDEVGEDETLFVTHVQGTDLEAARRVTVTSEGVLDEADEESETVEAAGQGEGREDDTDAGAELDEDAAGDSTLVEAAPAGAEDAGLQERGEE